jgi:hypothetical protein
MNRSIQLICVSCVFLLVQSSTPEVVGDDVDQQLKAQIVAQLAQRQKKIHSLRLTAHGTHTVAAGAHDDKPDSPPGTISPPRDTVCDIQRKWLIDFDRGFIRVDQTVPVWNPPAQEFFPLFQALMYDGSKVRVFRPKEQNRSKFMSEENAPELILYATDKGTSRLASIEEFPVFFASGLLFYGQRLTGAFRQTIDTELLRVAGKTPSVNGNGYDKVSVEVRQSARGSSPTECQYELDLKRQAAVLSVVSRFHGALAFNTEIKHQETKGMWLPDEWRTTLYSDGKIKSSTWMKITDVALVEVMDASQFSVQPRAGSVVRDVDGKLYRVGQDGESMHPLREVQRVEHRTWLWVLAGALQVGVIVAVTMVLRRRRNRVARTYPREGGH